VDGGAARAGEVLVLIAPAPAARWYGAGLPL